MSVAVERVEGCSVTEGLSCGRVGRGHAEGCDCERALLCVCSVFA